jgi:hypothetical protein
MCSSSVSHRPPGEKHWHGATATAAVTHIAIQERLDGKVGCAHETEYKAR